MPLLGGSSDPLTISLPGGHYQFVLNTASGINVAEVYTLDITSDHTYSVDTVGTNTSGNILNNDAGVDGFTVTDVNGVTVAGTGTTTITGHYGTLTIDAQGNYTYTLRDGVGVDSITTPDSFVYTITGTNGDTSSATLNITPVAHAVDAIDDTSALMAVTTAQDTTAFSDTSVGSASWTSAVFNSTSGSGSGTIEIAADTAVKDATLHFNVNSGLALSGLNVTWQLLDGATVVANGSFSGGSLIGGNFNVALTGVELHSGNYTLSYTGTIGALSVGNITITPSITGTTWDLNNYETTGTHTVTGNIYDGTDSAGALDQLGTVHTVLTVDGAGGSTTTLDPVASSSSGTVAGQYGSLTINLDGSYTYTLNSNVALSSMTTKETFSYTLNDQNGHTDTATLTIDMNPQIVSTAQADAVIGSAYGDTLIYHLLNSTNATGGNGTADTWSNFSLAQGDKIDIGDLLVGWDGQQSSLGNFLTVTTNGTDTTISIDRDGSAGATYTSTQLITLENVNTTLDELVQQNHITG